MPEVLNRSTLFRPIFRFTPSKGLPIALSQYAPGKEVWIGNKLWTSGAVYSPMRNDRYRAWESRRSEGWQGAGQIPFPRTAPNYRKEGRRCAQAPPQEDAQRSVARIE